MGILATNFVLGKSRAQDLASVRELNAWCVLLAGETHVTCLFRVVGPGLSNGTPVCRGQELDDVSILRQMCNLEVLSLACNNLETLR